jgi:hypothetical protein
VEVMVRENQQRQVLRLKAPAGIIFGKLRSIPGVLEARAHSASPV